MGGVVTVTDGAGRILTVHGDRETLRRARDSNMSPWSCWSEWATGNERDGHRARGARTGADQRAPNTGAPAFRSGSVLAWAVPRRRDQRADRGPRRVDVGASSFRRGRPSGCPTRWAAARHDPAPARPGTSGAETGRRVHTGLKHGARTGARRPGPPAAGSSSPTRMQASSSASRRVCPHSTQQCAGARDSTLGHLARHATKQARLDHGWVGSTQIVTQLSREPCRVNLRPRLSRRSAHSGRWRHSDLQMGTRSSTRAPEARAEPPATHRGRQAGERMVLLRPAGGSVSPRRTATMSGW